MDECTICLENIDPKTSRILVGCRHSFHKECIYKWSIIENSCPKCRKDFDFDTDNQKDFLEWMDLKLDNFNRKYVSPKQRLTKLVEIVDTTIRLSEKGIKCSISIYKVMLKKMVEYERDLNFSMFAWLCDKFSFGNGLVCEYGWYGKRIEQLKLLSSN